MRFGQVVSLVHYVISLSNRVSISPNKRYTSNQGILYINKHHHRHKSKIYVKQKKGPSKYMKTPSFRRHGLRWRTMTAGMTFFLRSGFPFLTVAITMSPTHADGSLLSLPFIPFTDMIYRFFAPVLSAQFTVAATGSPSDILNLFPADPPRPAGKTHRQTQNED